MLTVLGGLAEFERSLIIARTGEGRARAKARGVHMGRPSALTRDQQREALARRDAGRRSQILLGHLGLATRRLDGCASRTTGCQSSSQSSNGAGARNKESDSIGSALRASVNRNDAPAMAKTPSNDKRVRPAEFATLDESEGESSKRRTHAGVYRFWAILITTSSQSSLNVRFGPNATELLHRREMTRRA